MFAFAGFKNQAYQIEDRDMLTFSGELNYIDITWNSGGRCHSTDFYASGGASYTVTWNFSSFSGSMQFDIRDRSAGTLISNTITTTSATGSGTLTLTTGGTPTPDAFLEITGAFSSGSAQGWVTLELPSSFYAPAVPTITGIKTNSAQTNGAFSVGNIINEWWQDDRPSRTGIINGSDYTFDNTQYNLKRKVIRIHYDGVINPLFGFNDGDRIGMIDRWTRDLDTDYYDIYLKYQEDE